MENRSYSYDEIEQETFSLLRRFGLQDTIPVPLVDLCHRLGIDVFRQHFAESTLSGLVVVEGSRVAIHVSQDQALVRQRFTIAHELGHFWLHLRGSQQNGGFQDTPAMVEALDSEADAPTAVAYRRDQVINATEREANRFAASLLMPAPLVRAAFRRPEDLPRLAQWFAVSLGSLTIRIRELGLS